MKDNEENQLFIRRNRCDFIGPVYFGSSNDQTGLVNFYNSSSQYETAFQAGIATAAALYIFPTAVPAGNNYVLGSSTAGVLSWINAAGTYGPIGAAYVTIGNDATLTADRALTGTANQIVITDNGANSTVVLSTPQNINIAATPTFASETLTAVSNQLILGTTRTVTLTAPTPGTTSRVITFPDQSADYSVVATQGTQTVSGTKTFDGQLIGKGTATNDSAAAGYIGEYIESNQTTNTNFPTTTQYGDLTSISLTAGDWDVSGVVCATLNGSTATAYEGGISTTTGNSTTGLTFGVNRFDSFPPTAAADSNLVIPDYRISISGTTTVYLKYRATYSLGTPQSFGCIRARRVR